MAGHRGAARALAVGDAWRARRPEAIGAIADGLRAIHAVPIADFPAGWTEEVWVGREPASLGRGRLSWSGCSSTAMRARRTRWSPTAGAWTGHVDFGDLAVGDRWADLAVASLSLDWNFGEGHQDELFEAYGIEPTRSGSATTGRSGSSSRKGSTLRVWPGRRHGSAAARALPGYSPDLRRRSPGDARTRGPSVTIARRSAGEHDRITGGQMLTRWPLDQVARLELDPTLTGRASARGARPPVVALCLDRHPANKSPAASPDGALRASVCE